MWAQILNSLIGIWLMAAPNVLGYNGVAADVDHIVGPIVTTFAVVALSGCTRKVGRLNIIGGVWLIAAPWILGYDHSSSITNAIITGILITAFSLFKRQTQQEYGGVWSQLLK